MPERLARRDRRARAARVDELFWGARRLRGVLAAERPLLLVFEDVDRGEPTFLDLLDYLHSRIEGRARARALPGAAGAARPAAGLVRAARPRGDRVARTAFGGAIRSSCSPGSAPSSTTRPASASCARPRATRSTSSSSRRWPETGDLVVPPTIQALLAERLDRLEAGERAILERAAIVGQEFSRRAVTDLCPPELRAEVGRHLLALVRKELVRPHASASSAEDGYRFRHGLIRDVAYDGMPKEARALFHEWFADWMERNAGERLTEIEEIVGYHLEQAVRLRLELGPADARTRRLAARAVERLGASGRRAFGRDDVPAAVNLLERTAALLDWTTPGAPSSRSTWRALHAQRRLLERTRAHGGHGRGRPLGDRRLLAPAEIEHAFVRCPPSRSEHAAHGGRSPRARSRTSNASATSSASPAMAWWLLSEPQLGRGRSARGRRLERALEHATAPAADARRSACSGAWLSGSRSARCPSRGLARTRGSSAGGPQPGRRGVSRALAAACTACSATRSLARGSRGRAPR